MSELYKFQHITDLAKLKECDIDEFCNQLPSLIRDIKTGLSTIELLSKDVCDASAVVPYITWANDGLDKTTVTATFDGEEIGSLVYGPDA